MIEMIKKHWPLGIGIGILWGIIIITLALVIRQNHGHFVYVLDDPYIHMAMAKNFVQHGVLGVTDRGFTSASSSPLWVLLLSFVYFLFGVNEISPFILNVIFGSLTLFLVYTFLRKSKLRSFPIFLCLCAVIFFTPLPTMIFIGMEHTLHILVTIIFVYLASRMLSQETSNLSESFLLLLLAALLPVIRYEGLFLILVAVILFAFKKRLSYSFSLLCAAALPITVYGVISVLNGWYFLPNSILLKGSVPGLSLMNIDKFLQALAVKLKLKRTIILVYAFLLNVFIYRFQKQKTLWKNSIVMAAIFSAIASLHLVFASIGWFYRYEAYIVATCVLVTAIVIHENLAILPQIKSSKHAILIYVLIAFFIFPPVTYLTKRGFTALRDTPRATTNIYEQQYQMGLFLNQFYTGKGVAANDIGAINYLASINCLDLWGLASLEVLKAKRNNCFNTQKIYSLSKEKDVKLVIVFDYWFTEFGGMPPQWIKCGQWKIIDNRSSASDTISFYAVNPLEANNLMNNLKAFSSHLPKSVIQMGAYTE